MRLFMSLRRTHSPAVAGAKAGFSSSAAYRFEKDPRLPTQKKSPRERRRADPFADVWENDVLPFGKAAMPSGWGKLDYSVWAGGQCSTETVISTPMRSG